MQVCTSLQTDNHASTPPPDDFLLPNQQRQSTEGKLHNKSKQDVKGKLVGECLKKQKCICKYITL